MMTAAEPLIVTISHRLGRDEAKRRIESGLGAIRGEIARYVKEIDYRWDGYRLDFRVSAMMQTITGQIEVYEEFVKVEINLPRLLHLLGKRIAGRIERRGAVLLEGPKRKE
jgi:Putative polyhydroxyalkanoic acid system protein (PHA_gran_rgn)